MKDIILDVKDLTISFPDQGQHKVVLNRLSYTLHRGEILGMVGESGSGKSISGLALMQLLSTPPARISCGRALFYDQKETVDLLSLPSKTIRRMRGNRIGMIFQEPMTSLNPVHTCGQQVAEVLKLHLHLTKKAAKQRVIELFDEVRLPNPERIFKSYPHELSGGQRQRVMIAMAIACKPDVLIADEPTTALDVTIQKTVLELLQSLRKQHDMAIIFITHDLGVVKAIADNVLVLFRGETMEYGSIFNIFHHPQHAYTKGLLSCRPSVGIRYENLPTVDDYLTQTPIKPHKISSIEERNARHQSIYTAPPLLEIKNLSVNFPVKKSLFGRVLSETQAVKDVKFNIYQGETLGIVGESGCGKTTIGRTILQLVNNYSGQIIYRGRTLNTFSPKELRKVRKNLQIIFQDPYSSLNPRLTVGESILEPMRIHHIRDNETDRRKKALEILDKVGLPEKYLHRYPHELSGGQRQRVGIARALGLQPELIICDESVSALDVSIQAKVLNLLNALKKEFGLTYVFISHDLSVVHFMSDRIIVLQKGQVVEENEADKLYLNPEKAYTKSLLSAIPR